MPPGAAEYLDKYLHRHWRPKSNNIIKLNNKITTFIPELFLDITGSRETTCQRRFNKCEDIAILIQLNLRNVMTNRNDRASDTY